jgi:hypothetical protein
VPDIVVGKPVRGRRHAKTRIKDLVRQLLPMTPLTGTWARSAWRLPWRQVPVARDTRERGHGRAERRTIKVASVAAGLLFPYAVQAIQIVRRRKVKGKWSRETCYAITSLTVTQATCTHLAAIIRGHWGIEDRLHWVRDVDFDEDRSQIRAASGPRVMAALRIL